MTRAQVMATETARPSEIRESSGETIVRYDSIGLGGLASRVVYIFANDKLVRAKHVFDLEQYRASSADILPSDRFAGLSIAAGYLKLYTRWRGDRTKISHGLTGEDSGITHQVEFLSVELEKLEGEVRGATKF